MRTNSGLNRNAVTCRVLVQSRAIACLCNYRVTMHTRPMLTGSNVGDLEIILKCSVLSMFSETESGHGVVISDYSNVTQTTLRNATTLERKRGGAAFTRDSSRISIPPLE